MINSHKKDRRLNALFGFVLILLLVLVTAVAVGRYRGAFTAAVRVDLISDRAGLLMDAGSDVKVSNVVVGRVASVALTDNHAVIAMDLQPDQVAKIPANVGAQIAPTTLFGRKFVSLTWPDQPSSITLAQRPLIDTAKVTVEVNDAFDALLGVLDHIEPQKVNGTLGAVATALSGRGHKFGDLMVDVDHYLADFNGSIPTLQRDVPLLADNLDTFTSATPEFLATVDHLSSTSRTIVEKQAQLSAFLMSFTELGNVGDSFLADSEQPVIQALDALAPTSNLLGEYAPSYPCFFASLNQSRRYLERGFGGDRPGLNILGTILMGDPPYTYPEDLPENGADGPAQCYSYGAGNPPPGHTPFDVGTRVYDPMQTPGDLLGNPFASLIYGLTR
ncbi:MCE family protein [Rhodococcus opacus]|uniref:MCE family protein n=1 Tax=Rhodococcus opacus TaxID=37919 RepID=UPI0010632E43|nr:MCE family protein [Rhodococcus opacus]UZG52824.1 MCE family protein [Rhodococcus opacus]